MRACAILVTWGWATRSPFFLLTGKRISKRWIPKREFMLKPPEMSMRERANILLVDDKKDNIFALEQILCSEDRNLIRAGDGIKALRTVLNAEIDLIILDVQMPGMDGFEVAKLLKSNKRSKDIPIIFATAEKKEHKSALKGFEEGAVD